jgi:hypothetical protein
MRKDFSNYLEYFNEFTLWQYVFPGMKINNNIIPCNSLELYLANLFKDEAVIDFTKFQDRLIQECFIPSDIAQVVTFLIWFQSFNPEKVMEFFSKRNGYKGSRNPITDELLQEWISIDGLTDNMFSAFIGYRPTTSSQELMSRGLKGRELGEEIKRLEIEKFKQLI